MVEFICRSIFFCHEDSKAQSYYLVSFWLGGDNYFEYKKEYENLQTTFNPVKFDPERWAEAASKAGMKYVVFTTKHHDGFCMFDSKYTDYKITDKECPFSVNPKANITHTSAILLLIPKAPTVANTKMQGPRIE